MANLLIYGNTHTGMRRKENEDAFICKPLWIPQILLLAAIDGVGGYAGGAHAAELAKTSIEQYMKEPKGDLLTMLKEAVIFANNSIAAERERSPQFADMCCVLTAAVADMEKETLSYVHVGDSRLYRFSDGKLQKRTKDHSLVGMQEDAGEITEQEAMSHPQRHMILREIGSSLHRVDDPGFLEYGTMPLLPGDQVLLCSDGLSDMLSSYELQAVLQQPFGPDKKVEKLINMANEAGGQDNITVVMAKHPLAARKPGPAKHRKTDISQTVQPETKETPIGTDTDITQPTGQSKKYMPALFALLILGLLGASGWIYFSNANGSPKKPDSIKTAPVIIKDSGSLQPAAAVAELVTDSVFLDHSLSLQEWRQLIDSAQKNLLLLPANNSRKMAAIDLNKSASGRNDTVDLRNTIIKGFDTGVITRVNIFLRLNNTAFDSVKYPVLIPIKR